MRDLTKVRSIHRIVDPDFRAAQDRQRKVIMPTAKNPLIISASELRDWLRCRVKHHWRHQMRLVPKTGTENLSIGLLVHIILEKWYSLQWRERSVKNMRRIAKKILRGTVPEELKIEDLELIEAMTVGYADWAKEEDAEIGLRECIPERWFAHPLTRDKSIIVRGKIDNVFEPKEFRRVLGCHEYKTKAQIKVDVVEMMLQITIYLWALRKEFPKYKRYVAYYNVLRKQLPGPRVKAALFHREAVERSDEEIEQWEDDTARSCLDMLGGAVYPNPMDACSWDCDFRMPCLQRSDPSALRASLKREYKLKEYR